MDNLSKDNIDKLCMTGIYQCKPQLKWIESWRRDDPYHCTNWTFRVKKYKDDYYMHDTYWSSGGGLSVKLTDENFDKFHLLFDKNEVEEIHDHYFEYPEDKCWIIPIDSGGINHSRCFVLKGTKKDKDKVIERLESEIRYLKSRLDSTRRQLNRVLNDEADLRYV